MKRPLLTISLAFMLGIVLSENIIWTTLIVVLFFICFLLKEEYKKAIILFIVAFIIGNTYLKVYESIYNGEIEEYNGVTVKITGTVYLVDSDDTYLIKNVNIDGKNIKSNIRIKSENLEYGDRVTGTSKLKIPNKERNKGGFNYRKHLKTQKIYLTGTLENVKVIAKNQNNVIEEISERIRGKVREFTENSLNKGNSGILEALIIGDDGRIEEEINEQYKKAGMIHLLVVSGGHIAFLILLITYILKLLNINKITQKYILIGIIIMYIFITGGTPSVLRAGIVAIIILIADLIGRQNDTLTTLGFVALMLSIENPNIIYSLSFQLSFLGTLGIVLGYSKLEKLVAFLPKAIREAGALTISAQIFVTPITLYNFNTVYLGGIISNIFSMSLAGVIMMVGIIMFPIYLMLPPLINILIKPLELMISLMTFIAKVFSNIPFLTLTLPTPSIIQIIIYFIIVFYCLDINIKILIKSKKNENKLPILYRRKLYNKTFITILGVISILVISLVKSSIPIPLEINMIDVGHGDSIFIVTPNKKTILIDTGDSYSYSGKIYDSGEQTVVPYILDKGFCSIDLLVLSHLDSDHIGGVNSVLDNLKVKQVGISVNSSIKETFSEIDALISKEKAKKIYLKQGQEFTIDDVNFKVLYPNQKEKIEDENNDSIVLMITYQGKKALFMGDLEKEGEEELINEIKNLDIDILKVGHHGSITSTTEELVNRTTPKVALISVGNRFKSIPSEKVLNRLGSVYSKVYRTDESGGVTVKIDKGKIFVETIY